MKEKNYSQFLANINVGTKNIYVLSLVTKSIKKESTKKQGEGENPESRSNYTYTYKLKTNN